MSFTLGGELQLKLLNSLLVPISVGLFCATSASAQARVDFNVGFGSAWDSTNSQGIDNGNSALNPYGSCALNSGDAYCQGTPGLRGFFLGFGGDFMINRRFGVGAEMNFQPSQSSYGPLQYRQIFYDFNGVYEPIHTSRVSLQLQGGIGGADTSFGINQNSCVGTAVCTSDTESVGSSKHFQEHVGVALQIGLTQHIFVRPQFDYHYVNGFTNQFKSDSVPEATLWLGYTFGPGR
jgi:hypothetical protein